MGYMTGLLRIKSLSCTSFLHRPPLFPSLAHLLCHAYLGFNRYQQAIGKLNFWNQPQRKAVSLQDSAGRSPDFLLSLKHPKTNAKT